MKCLRYPLSNSQELQKREQNISYLKSNFIWFWYNEEIKVKPQKDTLYPNANIICLQVLTLSELCPDLKGKQTELPYE